MSSFVIDKVNYVRVGALVAGIKSLYKDSVWFYNSETKRDIGGWDFVQKFLHCYYMNVESVDKQYNLETKETAKNDNDFCFITAGSETIKEYFRYFHYGQDIAGTPYKIMEIVWKLIEFSRSVNYQIEDPVCNSLVMEWFNAVIVKLTRLANTNVVCDEQWGEFDLHLDGATVSG